MQFVTKQYADQFIPILMASVEYSIPFPQLYAVDYGMPFGGPIPPPDAVPDSKMWQLLWPNGFDANVGLLAEQFKFSGPFWFPSKFLLEYRRGGPKIPG